LTGEGIEEKDIKTQNYNLYPKWRWEERVCPAGSYCPGEQVQDGFEVSQTVTVKVRETSRSGEIISGVGERGATNISNLSFTVDDTDKLRGEAREMAITDAKEKADKLAEQLGVEIVRITGYYENGGGFYEPYYEARAMNLDAAEEAGFGGAKMPVGEQETMVTVNVTYEVK